MREVKHPAGLENIRFLIGDSEDEDAQWPPDASGFMGTETPVASPPKPRKTTPPVARRPPKKKAAFVVPRRGSKDAVHL